ncbi:hypothetical protein JFU18_06195 [Bacillus sp. TH22]|uniref:hypothetical protein n=1 Tax=unclassified Bacillus (in: firmicutes) TaxID=185979 RepID=UPI0019126900|nr:MULTISPECIES: hypothetical protein [unclassified Bacillus (in: firmicutes)]MBK5448239.1 hypothetical protein [Bacillus sp. TH22]MBK5452917.1 hypothetical protein [Bacillus sp. TH23]
MKKKTISAGIITAVITSVAFYIYSGNETKFEQPTIKASANAVKNVEQVITSADFAKGFRDAKALTIESDVIVEGKVLDSEYFDFNTNTFTRSKIQVSKSFNDAVKAGDIIQIVEIGGKTTKGKLQEYDPEKLKIPKDELNTEVEVLFDGAPTSKKDDEVLIFAKEDKEDFFGLKEKVFITLNSYQGKFTIDKDKKVKRYAPKHNLIPIKNGNKNNPNNASPIKNEEFSSLETTLSDMENQIINNLKK